MTMRICHTMTNAPGSWVTLTASRQRPCCGARETEHSWSGTAANLDVTPVVLCTYHFFVLVGQHQFTCWLFLHRHLLTCCAIHCLLGQLHVEMGNCKRHWWLKPSLCLLTVWMVRSSTASSTRHPQDMALLSPTTFTALWKNWSYTTSIRPWFSTMTLWMLRYHTQSTHTRGGEDSWTHPWDSLQTRELRKGLPSNGDASSKAATEGCFLPWNDHVVKLRKQNPKRTFQPLRLLPVWM